MAQEEKEMAGKNPKPWAEKAQEIGKRLIKIGVVLLLVAVVANAVIGPKETVPQVTHNVTEPAIAEPEDSMIWWDLSQRRENFISEARTLPAGEWVTVSFPCYRVKGGTMWYQITASPHVEVEYDFLDGTPLRKDGPGKMYAVEQWPPVIKVRAKQEGKIELTLNRQLLPDKN